MGGSAITGLLISQILKRSPCPAVYVNQNYSIPKWVNDKTLVIACSYSGNTEETILACTKCLEKTSKVIGFSTGGKLFEFLKEMDYNQFVKLPKGLQPRASIGYSLPLMLLLLNKISFNKELTHITQLILNELLDDMNDLIKRLEKYLVPNTSNPAYTLATKIYNKNPIIYAEDGIPNTIGYRFKCQLAENSKILAFNNSIPEMNHNELEAFTKNFNKNNNFVVVWIENCLSIDNEARIKIISKILENNGVEQYYLNISTKPSLGGEISPIWSTGVNLVDWISFHCAILNKVDPSIIPNINELKKSL